MKFRNLLILPVAWLGLFLILDMIFIDDPDINSGFHYINLNLTNLMFLAGCLLAALKFKPGDYLRKAWLWLVACAFFINFYNVIPVIAWMGADQVQIGLFQGICNAFGNTSAVVGIVMLSRAWRIAELELPGPEWAQLFVQLIAVALALILAGPAAVYSLGRVLDGDYFAIEWLSSALGDIICLGLIAPLLLTALALRGGVLSWPWIFQTLSLMGWLFVDAIMTVLPQFYGTEPGQMNTLSEVFRIWANLFGFLAGLAQRLVVDQVRKQIPNLKGENPS